MCNKMNWAQLLTEERFHASKEDGKGKENGRSQFEKDIDRITFSSAFRRLGRKTQVHLLAKNDHIHTRLSHSLEVACVGRSLGVMVGQWLKDENRSELKDIKDFSPSKVGEIVEAACLSHDIGNPPFGHAAEDAIREWFREEIPDNCRQILEEAERWDLERFDGNAMAFRVITYKEYYVGIVKGGMRLTYPTLGALLKYPWTSHFADIEKKNKFKFSCFKTEYNSLCKIAKKLGMIEKIRDKSESKAEYARHPLAYLVEAADDICYHVLDIEDAIQLNLLPSHYLNKHFSESLNKELTKEQKSLLKSDLVSWNIKNGLLRGKMIGCMIEEIVSVFKKHYDKIMQGNLEGDLLSKMANISLCAKLYSRYEKENLYEKIYRNDRNLPLELGAYSLLRILLRTSTEAAYEIFKGKDLSYKTKIVLKFIKQDYKKLIKGKNLYQVIMLFLDYVTGMTDGYATYVNKQLLGLGN